MANDERDHWGETLRAAERVRENQYFAKLDRELLARMRTEQADASGQAVPGDCPNCRASLRSGLWRSLEIEFCPECGGLWLDPGDLLQLAEHSDMDLVFSERKPAG